MHTESTKHWDKHFTLFALGKEFSLGGRALLLFALPLYILLETGDPLTMGSVLATSALPAILVSPIGGVMVDRLDKRKLLLLLNSTTALSLIAYLGLLQTLEIVPATVMLMTVLLTLGSLVSLTAKASVPALVPKNALIKANSFTFLLATCSSIIIPIIGGFILTTFGLFATLITSISLYLMAIVMNILTEIPGAKQEKVESWSNIIVGDMKAGIRFITKEKPEVGRAIVWINMLTCITLMPLITIALPVLVTLFFEKSETVLGVTQAIIGLGGIAGVLLMNRLYQKINMSHIRLLLLASTLALLPVCLAFIWRTNDAIIYFILVLSLFIVQGLSMMMGIICRSYFGEKAPEGMVGKVMALNWSLVILGTSLGGYLHGFLWGRFIEIPGVALLILAGLSMIAVLGAKMIRSSLSRADKSERIKSSGHG
ncbi:MAG: MFS transporter [Turicibacter sp.]|nr:MFS transporter [Turicibacter sp.]